MKQARLDNVQALRALAAVAVVIEHAFDQLRNHPILDMPLVTSIIGSAWGSGVDLFFVISGFIMYFLTHDHFATRGYPQEFMKRRFVRVLPTYYIFTTAMIAVAFISPKSVNNEPFGLWHVVSSYLFIPSARSDGAFYPVFALGWTLNFEMFFYVAFAMALTFPRKIGLTILIAAFLLLSASHPLVHGGPLLFWSDPIILEFIGGILISVAFTRGIRIRDYQAWLLIVAAVALAIILNHWAAGTHRLLRGGVPSLLLAAALILRPNLRWTRLPLLLGDASFSLYLSHPFALNIVTVFWRKLSGPLIPQIYLAALILGSLLMGIIVFLVLERPLLRLLRRLFEPKRAYLAA